MCWPKFSSASTPSKLMWWTPCRSPCATTSKSAALEALSSTRTRRSLPWLHRQQTPLLLRAQGAPGGKRQGRAGGVLTGGWFGSRCEVAQGVGLRLARRLDHSRRQRLHRLPLRGLAKRGRLAPQSPAQEELQAADGYMGRVLEQAQSPRPPNSTLYPDPTRFQHDASATSHAVTLAHQPNGRVD